MRTNDAPIDAPGFYTVPIPASAKRLAGIQVAADIAAATVSDALTRALRAHRRRTPQSSIDEYQKRWDRQRNEAD